MFRLLAKFGGLTRLVRDVSKSLWNILPALPRLGAGRTIAPLQSWTKKETSMKRFALILAPLAFAGAAFAQTLPEVPDADGNGTWSLVELQAIWTDLTEEGFAAIDTNMDGEVDAAELQAALDAGVITAPEG
jgi:hypothetical protein